jgi:uncharacterized membrane protein YhaH (DUF805 family)
MPTPTMFTALQRYADFQGRARRSEFWLFYLFQMLVLIAAFVVAGVIAAIARAVHVEALTALGGLLVVGVMLGLFVPSLAVAVRRLHDSDKSGWLLLLAFVPFGGFVLLIFYCLDSTPGKNKYGADPKGRQMAEAFA